MTSSNVNARSDTFLLFSYQYSLPNTAPHPGSDASKRVVSSENAIRGGMAMAHPCARMPGVPRRQKAILHPQHV